LDAGAATRSSETKLTSAGTLWRVISGPQGRYLLVGGTMAALYALLVWAYHSAGLVGWLASLLASTSVAGPTFALHRRFTFGASGPLLGQFLGYLSTVVINVPFGAVTVYLLLDVLGIHPFISGLGATVVTAVLNFVLLSRLVFKPSRA